MRAVSELFRFQTSPDQRPRAVVASVQLQGVDDGEHDSSLRELERLATTLGLEVIGRVSQRRIHGGPARHTRC